MNHLYYYIKPLIPRALQVNIRRRLVKRKLPDYLNSWPILEEAGRKPDNWNGWPQNKKFSFILTHDVELQKGHDRSIKLMNIEKDLGFKSSFNFVPERYDVSADIRNEITKNGFEVGVHGLNHDGKLYKNEEEFKRRAVKINNYIKEWKVTGFRSPSMHHNLKWLHQLNIDYDLSTFDTDPFEPQSDGMGTIFPFWVSENNNGKGYVEMPYTLPQDFTTFILLQEKNADLWKRKLDWIVEHGGMALVNVHPDYINFTGGKYKVDEFPVDYYIDFLEYVKNNYKNEFWNDIPQNLAEYYKTQYFKVSGSNFQKNKSIHTAKD